MEILTRIAPTPNGHIHLGNVFNFVLTWREVKKRGGQLGLRIDDLDQTRVRPAYVREIFQVIDWLKTPLDFGPKNSEDFFRNYSQGPKFPIYFKLCESLLDKKLAYACECSRKDISQVSPSKVYPGTCREKKLDFVPGQHCLRFSLPSHSHQLGINLAEEMGDFVLWRKENIPSYQLVSLYEDETQKINLLVRGEDLKTSSAAQLELAQALCYKDFQRVEFIHHPLILDEKNKKLSKSTQAQSFLFLCQEKGEQHIWNLLARYLDLPSGNYSCLEDFLP